MATKAITSINAPAIKILNDVLLYSIFFKPLRINITFTEIN